MKAYQKIFLGLGAIALSLLGGDIGYHYYQHDQFRKKYECFVTDPAESCSSHTGFKNNCQKKVSKYNRADFSCQRISKTIDKILEEDVSFPFLKDSEFYSLLDEYADKRLSLSTNIERLGSLDIRQPKEVDEVKASINQMEEFLKKLERKGMKTSFFYQIAQESYRKDLQEVIENIEKGYFRYSDFITPNTSIYFEKDCREPKDKHVDPENPTANKPLISYFLCLDREEKSSRDKMEKALIKSCDEKGMQRESETLKRLCTLRKKAKKKLILEGK